MPDLIQWQCVVSGYLSRPRTTAATIAFFYEFDEMLHHHAKLDIVFISFILWNGVAKTMHLTGLPWYYIRELQEGQGDCEGSWEIRQRNWRSVIWEAGVCY